MMLIPSLSLLLLSTSILAQTTTTTANKTSTSTSLPQSTTLSNSTTIIPSNSTTIPSNSTSILPNNKNNSTASIYTTASVSISPFTAVAPGNTQAGVVSGPNDSYIASSGMYSKTLNKNGLIIVIGLVSLFLAI